MIFQKKKNEQIEEFDIFKNEDQEKGTGLLLSMGNFCSLYWGVCTRTQYIT